MISIAAPIIEDEEIRAVNEVLQSGMLAQGPKVAALEAAFADYCGTKFAVAVNSGTAALHAALLAAGVGPGDEVITTPFSFIATVNTILMTGAKPVLADIEPDTFNIDISKIEAVMTPKTKAVMPVHLYGQPCDYEPLAVLAEKHGLKVVEDACQAIGATYNNKKAGNLGDFGCFSLYATKNIMSGEGGVITTNEETQATLLKQLRQHGMSAQYEYLFLGYNYRITDLQAAIALEQLKKADQFNEQRQANAARLTKELQSVTGLVTPITATNRTHVFHQYTLRVTKDFGCSRDELMARLREKGVGAGVYYPQPLHAVKHIADLGYKMGDLPEAERAALEVLSLPVHPKVTDTDIVTIVKAIKDIANGR